MRKSKLNLRREEIINRYEAGESYSAIARSMGATESAVWYFLKRNGRTYSRGVKRPTGIDEILSAPGKAYLAYILARQWVYEEGRHETYREAASRIWHKNTSATIADVNVTVEEIRNAMHSTCDNTVFNENRTSAEN